MTALKLFLLGPPRVDLDGSPVEIQRRKAFALLIYLAVSGQPHSRDTLATLFYPDHSQSRARAYLRRDLATLNTGLAGDWLNIDRDTVELKPDDDLWLDIKRFRQCLSACQSHGHAPETPCAKCLPLLTEAIELYSDDFLAGFTLRDCPEFDDWQFFQAESLRQELAQALERLVQGCDHQDNYDTAIPYARRWVALDPLYEPAQRQLIQLYDQAGQPAAALRQFEEYAAHLEEELGLPPEEETTTLYEAIKAKRILGPYVKLNERPKEVPATQKAKSPPESVSPKIVAVTDSLPGKTPANLVKEVVDAVGRETELTRLHDFMNKALDARRQLVFVSGESGLGKTTLIDAFLSTIGETTSPWIGHGQCIEHRGTGEAYLPVLEALGRMCREAEGQTLINLLSKVAPTWLVQMPWLISAEDFEALQQKTMGTTRERMLREIVEAVEALTVHRPLVLVLEDLHWSDYSTLDLLTLLAQRQEPARLLIIGTYRPSDIAADDHPLPAVVNELKIHRQCTELSLAYLTQSAVETYLDTRFAEAALPTDVGHLLFHRTAGNPLFMRAVVDSWVDQGLLKKNGQWTLQDDLEALAISVPDDLRRLIEQQLHRLDADDQKILETAGVVGMEFSIAAVAVVIDLDEETLEDRCNSLARRGQFLRSTGIAEWPDGTVAAQFEFVHHLYQEVLYDRISAGRRTRLHRQIGDRLEAGYSLQASEMANELAMHFVQGHDSHRAVQYLHLAAEHALKRNAHREAVEHLQKGLDILNQHPDLPERAQLELVLQATLAPIFITIDGWSSPKAEAAYRRTLKLSQQLDDKRQLSFSLYGMATMHELRGEYAKSQALLEQRLRLPDSQDHGLIIESHDLLACSTFHQGIFDQAVNYANQGSRLYEAQQEEYKTRFVAADPGVACYHWGALALWFLGYPEQALARIEQAVALADQLAHSFSLAHANQRAAMLHQFRREEQVVQARAEAAINIADKRGFYYWGIMGDVLRGWALAIEGQTDEGVAKIRHGLETSLKTGAGLDYPYFLGLLAEAYSLDGKISEALEVITQAVDRLQQIHDELSRLYHRWGELEG